MFIRMIFSPCVWSCPLSISWTAQPLVQLCIMRRCVMRKNWFTIFNGKVTTRAYIIKIWLFLQYLLNCWPDYNQTWFGSTASQAGMSCGKIVLLHSRSRSQQRLKMLLNVCWDNIFLTTKHFVAKPGMVMQYHKPDCHAEKFVHCVQGQGHT